MATIYCPETCEHDLPFPHIAVITYRETREERIKTTMIVCKLCGHWIERPMDKCKCRAGCHSEARHGYSEGIAIDRTPLDQVR